MTGSCRAAAIKIDHWAPKLEKSLPPGLSVSQATRPICCGADRNG
jgi:hypothetical protein